MLKDYYKILQITRKSNSEHIKNSYRELIKVWHPDKNQNSEISISKTREIIEAYEILSNQEKKTIYDELYDELNSIKTEITQIRFEDIPKNRQENFQNKYSKILSWLDDINISYSKNVQKTLNIIDKPLELFFYYLPYAIILIFLTMVIANFLLY